jgi:hypothetical protein
MREPMNDLPNAELANRLRQALADRAERLRPFPSFLGMATIQAIELAPAGPLPVERGCVVVTPEGTICELALVGIAGVEGVGTHDFVEELRELDLPPEEYIVYARVAIAALDQALRLSDG